MIVIEMENGKKIEVELAPDAAPNTVKNFLYLANQGFYDGLIFHRVINGFMIQGGCPEGSGMGGPGYCIKGEFANNGVRNPLRHKRGVISMARTSAPNSAGSQFFIMHQDGFFLVCQIFKIDAPVFFYNFGRLFQNVFLHLQPIYIVLQI